MYHQNYIINSNYFIKFNDNKLSISSYYYFVKPIATNVSY